MDKPKARTKNACETCRRKKIKCSGDQPCLNCIQLKDEAGCNYIERIRKPKNNSINKSNGSRVSNAKSMRLMEDRLSRLEGFIINISDKLGVLPKDNQKVNKNHKINGDQFDDDDDDEDEKEDEKEDGQDSDNKNDLGESTESEETDESDEEIVVKDEIRANLDRTNSGLNSLKAADGCYDKGISGYNLVANGNGIGNGKKRSKLFEELTSNDGESYIFRDQFFESHSFFSAVSAKSLSWIASTLGKNKKETLNHFKRLPYYLFRHLTKDFKKFVDPVDITENNRESLLTKPLPNDYEFILLSINLILKDHDFIEYMCSATQIKKLLYEYFFSDKKLNNSNLLILCSITALIINVRLASTDNRKNHAKNKKVTPDKEDEILNKYSNHELSKIYDNLMTSAVLLYQRVCVIAQGIETIRGILLLVTTFELSGSMILDLNYIILSVAIRYAQEFGLHRSETYQGLNEEETDSRRKIWAICLYYDIEFCFRHGKPPVISSSDVLRSSREDLKSIIKVLNLQNQNDAPTGGNGLDLFESFDSNLQMGFLHKSTVEKLYNGRNFLPIIKYCQYSLLQLRFHSYFNLFTTVGNLRTVENLEMLLDKLNGSFFKVINCLIGEFKPRFYDDPEFHNYLNKKNYHHLTDQEDYDNGSVGSKKIYEEIVSTHFLFFSHLMFTNRVPFLTKITNDSPKIQEYRKLFIKSTRTILYLGIKMTDENFQPFSLVWFSFYPFAAFLILSSIIINNSQTMDITQDATLLINVLNLFFEIAFGDKKQQPGNNEIKDKDSRHKLSLSNNRFGFQCIVMKIFLEIVLGVIELKTNVKLTQDQLHLKQLEIIKFKLAPQLYSNKQIIDIKFISAYNDEENLSNSTTVQSEYDLPNNKSQQQSQLQHPMQPIQPIPYQQSGLIPNGESFISHGTPRHELPPLSSFNFQNQSPGTFPYNQSSPVMHLNQFQENSNGNGGNGPNGVNAAGVINNSNQNGSESSADPLVELFDDQFNDFLNSQVQSLPNFFFDNNLGFS